MRAGFGTSGWPSRMAGGYESRQLTRYTQDDGQDVGELTWTADGQAIVYVRGGDLENGGTYPNPASAPEGVEQDVWVVSMAGGAPRKLAEGHSPAVSPKGEGVAYIFKDQVWLVKLSEGAKPEQLIHDNGKVQFARDGRPTVRVSLSSAAAAITASWACTTWGARAWRISIRALTRIPRPSGRRTAGRLRSCGSPRAGRAHLWPEARRPAVVDPRGGRCHRPGSVKCGARIRGRGSVFRGIAAEHQIFWGAGDTLVFPWERDGWTHLYSVPVGGRHGKAPHARRFRSGVRFPQSRSPPVDFRLEPG